MAIQTVTYMTYRLRGAEPSTLFYRYDDTPARVRITQGGADNREPTAVAVVFYPNGAGEPIAMVFPANAVTTFDVPPGVADRYTVREDGGRPFPIVGVRVPA